ncbi:MAG: bifunctional demethylmenaquinone methyltransferase/2-methoxy-6-polyprenyl-1,4-benzoquinol methylase UbiE [Candidatus Omnitrophica bacterium]|nr:bifunctional demethylmenaquinone methyltransferase/2-methoxy-6-polyprenyl-1,4-benzoquinol methylase UbiE [Candidatus Omnitrophota bacterium]
MTTLIRNPDYSKAESWKIFDTIYRRYDLLNAILSFGLDKNWRHKLLKFVPAKPDVKLLDLATGTSDVAITLVQNCDNIKSAIGIDLSENMLHLGREKITNLNLSNRISLQKGDATQLSFLNDEFDMATMSFGIRNVENPMFVLKEIYRVLRTNGRAVILEFSLPKNIAIKFFYLIYLKICVPLLGGLISGNFKAYIYLNRTIEKFPYGEMFIRMMKQCGFKNVSAQSLMLGVATIYVGEKS